MCIRDRNKHRTFVAVVAGDLFPGAAAVLAVPNDTREFVFYVGNDDAWRELVIKQPLESAVGGTTGGQTHGSAIVEVESVQVCLLYTSRCV